MTVTEAIGLEAWRVEHPADLEQAVKAWLAAPGPALLDVVVERDELVMPPHVEPAQVFGMGLYSAKGLMAGAEGRRDVKGDPRRVAALIRRGSHEDHQVGRFPSCRYCGATEDI